MAKRSDNFQKFVKQKKGSAIKEEIKQAKRKEKKDRAAAIEKHFEQKRLDRQQQRQGIAPVRSSKPGKPARPNKYPRKDAEVPTENVNSKSTPFAAKDKSAAPKSVQGNTKTPRPNKYPRTEVTGNNNDTGGDQKRSNDKIERDNSPRPAVKNTTASTGQNKFVKKENVSASDNKATKEFKRTEAKEKRSKPSEKASEKTSTERPKSFDKKASPATGKTKTPLNKTAPDKGSKEKGGNPQSDTEQMPLNKYIAHSGICSRRDAAILVKEGKVIVNNETAVDPGMKIAANDIVKVSNKKITPSKNFVYILLNKPKDYITTSDDPQGHKTVLDLVRTATTERVYPVGRLDRNTSGVLLLTNDGELAQKLSHPKHEVKKVYEVKLDRVLTKGDMDKIANGITLEDGFVAPDVIAYADSKDKSIIGVEIHSGRNRIVRRIFEHLKYDVKGLDRVMFAGLTKKDVQRGNWRLLKEKEIRILKFMNQSFVKIKE